MIKRSLIVLVLFLCFACVHTMMLEESAVKYPPSSRVDILLEPPSRPYKQIAILESKAENPTTAMARIREKAKEIGADAIMPLNRETHTGVVTGFAGKWSFFAAPLTETNVSMVAIKYLD